MQSLVDSLKGKIQGEVYFDNLSRKIYSVDASIYQVDPMGVVVAKSEDDLLQAVQTANEQSVPIIPRGAATGIAGGCLGEGLIVDTSKYLNRILEINVEERYAICEPGVVQDQLNAAVTPYGLCLGPDTSTGSRATIGGMVGNNSAGAHSIRYGKMVDHTLEMDLIVAGAEKIKIGTESLASFEAKLKGNDRLADVYRYIQNNIFPNRELIDKVFPKIQRRVSGYNLDDLITEFPLNISRLITGSEGSFGLASKIKVKLSPKPKCTVLSVLHFKDFFTAFDVLGLIHEHKPFSVEMMDDRLIGLGKTSPSMKGQLGWLKLHDNFLPKVILGVEFDGDTPGEALDKQQKFNEAMARTKAAYDIASMNDKASQAQVWKVRKAGLGLLMSQRTDERAVAFLEDVAVSPKNLAPFIQEFDDYLKSHDKTAGFYGHAGVGCLHIRPMLDLKKQSDVDLMVQMMEDVSDILKRYGGAVSGEHGDGLTRSWLNEKMFGSEVYGLFQGLKKAFDPKDLMNPGKIVNAPAPRQNLKSLKSQPTLEVKTKYNFDKEGGFNFAVDMCNGNATCRDPKNLMCPSFQAHGDERHSTRARAQSLQAILNGDEDNAEFTGEALYEVMDLCLECKGCKTHCPSQVDMAKMKSEFLYHYQKKNGVSARTKFFGSVDKLNSFAAVFPKLSNALNKSSAGAFLFDKLGLTSKRSFPKFAQKRFSKFVKKRQEKGASKNFTKGKVVLFTDTFTEFNQPQVGEAVWQILEQAGFEVLLPPYVCCGRPLFSKGLLDEAQAKAQVFVDAYRPYIEQSIPLVGIEPGCLYTIADEFKDILSSAEADKLANLVYKWEDLLVDKLNDDELKELFSKSSEKVEVHTHCHQKSLGSSEATMKLLSLVNGSDSAHEIDSGCCGMAGSFGYEKEHYDFSMAVGESRLFPAIRQLDDSTQIIADGMSCRCQIEHGTKRKALHLAEYLLAKLS